MYINIIHPKKIHPIIPFTTLVLKYIFKISNSMTSITLSQIYFILKTKNNNPRCDVHTIPKKVLQKDYMWDYNWGGLSVLSPAS